MRSLYFALTAPLPLPLPLQGHILAALATGCIYHWGQGVAIDYAKALAAYKIGAEAGDAFCQYQVGWVYYEGNGVCVDFQQARVWVEKAAAQDDPLAVFQLGIMYSGGEGVTASFRLSREYYQRAIELGEPDAVDHIQTIHRAIADVTRKSTHRHQLNYSVRSYFVSMIYLY